VIDMRADETRAAPMAEPLDPPEPQGVADKHRRLHVASVLVLLTGIVLTVVLVAATQVAFETNEDRLLAQRTREAAAVLTASLPGIQTPLAAAAEVAEQDSTEQPSFERLMEPIVERGSPYVTASLWQPEETLQPVVVVGPEPKLANQPPEFIREVLDRSIAAPGLSVTGLLDGETPRLGYSYTASTGPIRFVAYAEAELPPNRTSVVPQEGSPFAGLNNAVYLGDREDMTSLLTATTSDLPFGGRRASEEVVFGDTTLLLVMSPIDDLGGQLLAALPWLVGLVGLVSTLGSTVLVERLLRRRDLADDLAAQNRRLYANQLSVARTLQHSLLPQQLPSMQGADFAARYVAGVAGLDIGGDWYDVVPVDGDRALIVIGDVSGRGLGAGTTMASLRFAIRAFASRGEGPATILNGLSQLLDVDRDGHFATVLCASVSLGDRSVTIANAGHPPPLLVDGEHVTFLATAVGPPIGVTADATYETVTHVLPAESTLLIFTDGLFERRGETIDAGLERLRGSVVHHSDLEGVLDTLIAAQIGSDPTHDDSALLGVRWTNIPTN
jgi:hypothetical protein